MNDLSIFTEALGLPAPWYIERVHFEEVGDKQILNICICIQHERRVKFGHWGKAYPVHDHQDRTWKHLNFFQRECCLHARAPRVKLEDGGTRLVGVPWSDPGSSFTLLFDQEALKLVKGGMGAVRAGMHLNITGKRVFGILRRYVGEALPAQGLAPVKELSVDGTSSRKGHNCLTILSDREHKKVVGASTGRDKEAFSQALTDMGLRGAGREAVRTVTMGMSPSHISAVRETMGQADIVFDRFHIAKKMNEAVDKIRREGQLRYKELKKSRYLWLYSHDKLNDGQRRKVGLLSRACPNIGEAHRLKELLREVLDSAFQSQRVTPLNEWTREAWDSGLGPVREFVGMLRKHWHGVKAYFKKLAANAYAERVNLKIQEIKRLAKGYRNPHNFVIMIYFHLGGLNLKPTKFG